MAAKVAPTAERDGRVGQRRQIVSQVAPKRPVESDDTLTPTEAAKVRHAVQQAKAGKARPWAAIQYELGL